MPYTKKALPTLSLLIFLCSVFGTGSLHAKCSTDARDEAQKLRSLAGTESNTDEAIFLLRTSSQICEDYATWMDLGRLESNRGAPEVAADYFSRARDSYMPDDNGELSTGKLRRLGTANTLLASALFDSGKPADALQALEAAKRYFATFRNAQPQRVLELQANIDDAMSSASAPTLTRSLNLQRSGSTRGVGIRQKVEETTDEFVSEDAIMLGEESLDELVDDQPLVIAQNEQAASNSTSSSITTQPDAEITQTDEQAALSSTPTDESDANNTEVPQTNPVAQAAPASSRLNIQVLFKFDSADIDSSGQTQVQKMADALNALQLPANTPVKIIGHTDVNGDSAYNLALSERRAATVADQIRNQVDGILLSPVGKGESEVRYPGSSTDDHRRNRRVEIVIN